MLDPNAFKEGTGCTLGCLMIPAAILAVWFLVEFIFS